MLKDFIFVKNNALDSKTCRDICKWFDLNIHKSKSGRVFSSDSDNKINNDIRKCSDIHIPRDLRETDLLNKILDDVFYESISQYEKINDFSPCISQSNYKIINDGYLLTLYDKGDYFKYHTDDCVCDVKISNNNSVRRRRILAFLLYLNDCSGGETIFPTCDVKIKPETGKIVIFPANWMFPHEGSVVKSKKYLITTFLYAG